MVTSITSLSPCQCARPISQYRIFPLEIGTSESISSGFCYDFRLVLNWKSRSWMRVNVSRQVVGDILGLELGALKLSFFRNDDLIDNQWIVYLLRGSWLIG